MSNRVESAFREPKLIKALAFEIEKRAKDLKNKIKIMEVCGGHTHTIMKYGLKQILPENIDFVHGPGCPVCVMPKEKIDEAYVLSSIEGVIFVTLGDMIKVPGSFGSLQDARALGADIRFVYSPFECIKIASENSDKKVIFYAIGFETTTPMSAALLKESLQRGIKNLFFAINHIKIPEVLDVLFSDRECKVNALIAPSHVSAITGAKIYKPLVERYKKPTVVSGFEPVDVLDGVLRVVNQFLEGRCELDIEYSRVVNMDGNSKALELIDEFFTPQDRFNWRGIGWVWHSSLKLKDKYKNFCAYREFEKYLKSIKSKDEHRECVCGEILKGIKKPDECRLFRVVCNPSNPIGSCMVSSEGACAAYYKYDNFNIQKD